MPEPFFGGPVAVEHRRFAILGDLQRTSLLELWRERNEVERRRVIAAIAEEELDFVALLGDLVFRGDSASDWDAFDALTAPLRRAALPVLPLLGNHDYGLWRARALRMFFARFPHLEARTYYSVDYGPLRLVFLDSNRSRVLSSAWAEQLRWYRETLDRADRDEAVAAVLVLVHHPPYTNSTVTGDDRNVREEMVPPFAGATKTIALISGHVHSYERFARSGKVYVVSGGGGGPRARLHAGERRRHHDDLYAGAPTASALRPFHYLRIHLRQGSLVLEARGLQKGSTAVEKLDELTIPFPSHAAERQL